MRKLLTGIAVAALGMSIGACNSEPAAENADIAVDANTEVLVDENAAMDANVVMDENLTMDANAMDANMTTNADNAVE